MKKLIIKFLFGKRIEGVKLSEPKKNFPIREMNTEDFNNWANTLKVSSRVPKSRMY